MKPGDTDGDDLEEFILRMKAVVHADDISDYDVFDNLEEILNRLKALPDDHTPEHEAPSTATGPVRCEGTNDDHHGAVKEGPRNFQPIVLPKRSPPRTPAPNAKPAKKGISPFDQRLRDVLLALNALGVNNVEALDLARKAQASLGSQATVEDLVRACLRRPPD